MQADRVSHMAVKIFVMVAVTIAIVVAVLTSPDDREREAESEARSTEPSEASLRADRRALAGAIERKIDEGGFSVKVELRGFGGRELRITSPFCNKDAPGRLVGKAMREAGFTVIVCDNGRGRNWRAKVR